MLLGEIIYDYRKRNGLTMKEFSERSGLTKGYISMLEKNYNPRFIVKMSFRPKTVEISTVSPDY